MSDPPNSDASFEDADEHFEKLIKALGGFRRFEIAESQDEPLADPDKGDKAEDDVLDFHYPKSLEELIALLDSKLDPDQRYQVNEAREKRIMIALYVFGGAGIIASVLTGNVAILAVILVFFYRLFRMLYRH